MAARKSARRKTREKATRTATTDPTAADAYKAHLRAISTLLLDTMHHVNVLQEEARDRKIGWTEVAGMERAREFTVEAAWALEAIANGWAGGPSVVRRNAARAFRIASRRPRAIGTG